MIEFNGSRERLRSLFTAHPHLPALRESVLEGRIGQVWVDDSEHPRIARMDVGCYSIFGGDSKHADAIDAIRAVQAPVELVYPDWAWHRRMFEAWESRLRDWKMTSFTPDAFSRDHLEKLAANPAVGFTIRPLQIDELHQLGRDLEPHGLQTHADPQALLQHGMAWGAVIHGRVACAATSYAQSTQLVEVAIATHPDSRGRGLATSTAAAFCIAALDRGLKPLWNASNPVSQRLALRLGYRRAADCVTLMLDA